MVLECTHRDSRVECLLRGEVQDDDCYFTVKCDLSE